MRSDVAPCRNATKVRSTTLDSWTPEMVDEVSNPILPPPFFDEIYILRVILSWIPEMVDEVSNAILQVILRLARQVGFWVPQTVLGSQF